MKYNSSVRNISIWTALTLILNCVFAGYGKPQSVGVTYDLDGGLCYVTQYSYSTQVECPDMATNIPGVQNASVFLESNPDGTLNAISNISFCTGTVPGQCNAPAPDATITGTLLKGKSPTGAETLQLQGAFNGNTITFTVVEHLLRYGRVNWTANPGVITSPSPLVATSNILVPGGSGGGGNCPCNPVPPIPSTSAHCVGPCGSKP